MSNALHAAISELEGELEALDQKRSDIEHTLTVMRRLAGEMTTTGRKLRRLVRAAKRRTNERTNERKAHASATEPP